MDPNGLIDHFISFGRDNPIIALAILFVFFFFLYRKPKFTLLLFILIIILVFSYFAIMDMASSGKAAKQRLIHESESSSTSDKQ